MKRIALLFLFFTVLLYQTSVFSQDSKNSKSPVAMEEQVTPEMNIANNKLRLRNAPLGSQVKIFSIIGIMVKEIKITSSEFELELNLPRGVYLFRMDTMVKKGVIK